MKWKPWSAAKRLGGKRCGIMCGLKCSEENILCKDTVSDQCYPGKTSAALGCKIDNSVSVKMRYMPHDII